MQSKIGKWVNLMLKRIIYYQTYVVKVLKAFSPSCHTRSHFHDIVKESTIFKVGSQGWIFHQFQLEKGEKRPIGVVGAKIE